MTVVESRTLAIGSQVIPPCMGPQDSVPGKYSIVPATPAGDVQAACADRGANAKSAADNIKTVKTKDFVIRVKLRERPVAFLPKSHDSVC